MLKQYYYPSSSMNSVMSSSSAATWEEKAFAEDAAGSLSGGGCIWPPRSYSCSFCMREFRSAQALGGHMNVHRRDRARLKQCLHSTTATTTTTSSSTATPSLATYHVPHHLQNHSTRFGPFSSPRAFLSPYSSSSSTTAAAGSWSGSKRADQLEKNVTLMRSSEDHDRAVICLLGSDDHQNGDHIETDLTVGLINSVVRGNNQLAGSCGEEAIATTCKRPKIGEATMNSVPFSFFLQPEASSTEADLDLELRLGDPTPKVT